MKRVISSYDANIYEKLQELAVEYGMTVSKLQEAIIREYLNSSLKEKILGIEKSDLSELINKTIEGAIRQKVGSSFTVSDFHDKKTWNRLTASERKVISIRLSCFVKENSAFFSVSKVGGINLYKKEKAFLKENKHEKE